MPHKHKRKHNARDEDDAEFDLPPEKRARPLEVGPVALTKKYDKEKFEGFGDGDGGNSGADGEPEMRSNKRRKPDVKKSSTATASQTKGKKKRGRTNAVDDDTPKQFARMMAWQQQARLKEKEKKQQPTTDKRALTATTSTTSKDANADADSLKIQAGESLSTFSQRVNRSLPLSGIPKSSGSGPAANVTANSGNTSSSKRMEMLKIPKDPLTRHNKHLQRMQSEWRNAETKLAARRAEEEADREEVREEHALLWSDVAAARNNKKGRKRKNGAGDDGEDVWKVLLRKRKGLEDENDPDNSKIAPAVAGLTAGKSVQAPLPQATVRKLDVDRVKRMFRVQ